jgi:hypothetical protein
MTDEFWAYKRLRSLGYKHRTLNSRDIADVITGDESWLLL